MTKPKKTPRVKRKFVLIEVETTLSNAVLKAGVRGAIRDHIAANMLQVHVNTANEVSRG